MEWHIALQLIRVAGETTFPEMPIDGGHGSVYNTIHSGVKPYQIVIDTNVLVSALRSSRCASYKLLSIIDSGKFAIKVSIPPAVEYEEVTRR